MRMSDWSSDVCSSDLGIPVIPGALYDGDNWNTTDALSRKRSGLGIDTQMVDARVVLQPTDTVTWRANARYERQDYDGTYWMYHPLTGHWGYPASNGSPCRALPGESGLWDSHPLPGPPTPTPTHPPPPPP